MKLPLFCLTHLAFRLWLASPLFAAPVRLVLDTDMSGDCDDAGALALLQALTDRGECELLATVINRKDFTGASAAATDAINTFYGRPDLPIGTDKQGPTALRRTSAFARALRDEFPSDVAEGDVFDADEDDGPDAPGGKVLLRVLEVTPETVILDRNHPLAGQKVRFDVEVLEVRPAEEAEILAAEAAVLAEGAEEPALIPVASLLRGGTRRYEKDP